MYDRPIETELKLSVEPEQFTAITSHPELLDLIGRPDATETLVSVYFDTPDFDLWDHGLTLRVRRIRGRWLQTLKSGGDDTLIDRIEWENAVADETPDLDRVDERALPQPLRERLLAGLKPIFETRIERTVYHLRGENWTIEMACDRGEIVAPGRAVPVSEIELELKDGDRAALFALARAIANAVPVQFSTASKSARGYALVDGNDRKTAKPDGIELHHGVLSAEAFQTIARACLRQIVESEPAVLRTEPEGLHQMRIGLRRLRSAFSLFKDMIADSEIGGIKSEIKWLTAELAPARDLDTFREEVIVPLRAQHRGHRGLDSLSRTLRLRQRAAYRRAHIALRSPRHRALLLETAAWIEAGAWLRSDDPLSQARRGTPAEIDAAEQFSRRRKNIRKTLKMLGRLDPAERHRLRVQIKKLRYAAEFFGSLFPDKKSVRRRGKMHAALKRLQTALGGLNDIATRKALCAGLIARRVAAADESQSRTFAAGLVTGDQESRARSLLDDAGKAVAKYAGAKPFWRLPASTVDDEARPGQCG